LIDTSKQYIAKTAQIASYLSISALLHKETKTCKSHKDADWSKRRNNLFISLQFCALVLIYGGGVNKDLNSDIFKIVALD
jgi:hypothetical protein